MTDETETEMESTAAEAAPEAGGAPDAMAEPALGEAAGPEAEIVGEAPMYDRRDGGSNARHKRAIFSVPVQVVVSVGRASPSIGELLNMRRDALIPLDTKLEDPVDIMIGKRVIARGELQEIGDGEGRLGVRLTEIVDLSEPF